MLGNSSSRDLSPPGPCSHPTLVLSCAVGSAPTPGPPWLEGGRGSRGGEEARKQDCGGDVSLCRPHPRPHLLPAPGEMGAGHTHSRDHDSGKFSAVHQD